MSTPLPCTALNCDFPSDVDLYSLDGLGFFTNGPLYFILNCPPGYYCPNFPIPWFTPPGDLPPIITPTITGKNQTINLRVRCAENVYVVGVVTVTVQPTGSSSGTISASISTAAGGFSGTVTVIGNVQPTVVVQAVQSVIQALVAKMQLECAEEHAIEEETTGEHIFDPNDPRNPPPNANRKSVHLSPLNTTEGCQGSAFQANISASSFYAPVLFSLFDGTLPPGLTISTIGPRAMAITGTPTTVGSYTFRISGQAFNSNYDVRQYTICIIAIAPATLPDGQTGSPYSQTLTATACALAPLSWQVFSGALPDGLTLDETTGLISGTPEVDGTFNFTILMQTQAT